MPNPPLIIQPFAAGASGGDIAVPPQTDPNGFVNFTQGYTPYYEISLGAGNPQAKAVERNMQNGLFNMITWNTQAWQQYNYPPWFAAMPGGYDVNACVIRLKGAVWTPYRSLVTGNVTDPLSAPASWEYIPYGHEMLANIPMPAGGPSGSSGRLITASTNFNTFTSPGTYEFQSDAVANGSANSPNNAVAGILEVDAWSNGAVPYVIQRYLDRNGYLSTRSSASGSWIAWATIFTVGQAQQNQEWFAIDTGTANAYTAPLVPGLLSRTEGLVLRIRIANTNTGPSTLNDGLGTVPIVNRNMNPLKGGEILAGGEIWVSWHSASGNYVIAAQQGGAEALGGGSYLTGNGTAMPLTISDVGNANYGASIKLVGNGATTPSKSIRAFNGNFDIVNDAYGATIFRVTDAGAATVYNGLTVGGTSQLNGPAVLGANGSYSYGLYFGSSTGPILGYNISTAVSYFTNKADTAFTWQLDDVGNETSNSATYTGIDPGNMGQVRMTQGNYGVGLRNDGAQFYILSTASGNQNGSFNTFRPFSYNLASGFLGFDGTGAGSTFGGAVTINGATTINSNLTLSYSSGSNSPLLAFNSNGYKPFIIANSSSPGYLEFINSANTRVNFEIDDNGNITSAGAAYSLAFQASAAGTSYTGIFRSTGDIGGSFVSWSQSRSYALQVDSANYGSAYGGIRWTRWGDAHIAAIDAFQGNQAGNANCSIVFHIGGQAYAWTFSTSEINRSGLGGGNLWGSWDVPFSIWSSMGYMKLPNGWLVQWGTATAGSNASYGTSYPISWPNAPTTFVCNHLGTVGSVNTIADANYIPGNKSVLSMITSYGNSVTAMWVAIGN